jgi:hypothetical protein
MERGYKFDVDGIYRSIGRPISGDIADLLEVAFAVYVADRLSPRSTSGWRRGDRGWQRALDLKIPVRDCARWNAPFVRYGLQDFLGKLTEDVWKLEFCARRSARDGLESQLPLIDPLVDDDHVICLFSGGFDSLAGAVDYLQRNEHQNLVCVGATTNSRIGFAQSELGDILGRRFRDRSMPIRVTLHLIDEADSSREEITQRSRGFIHLSLGAAVAATIGSAKLHVFENGIGAINLPYTAAQLERR